MSWKDYDSPDLGSDPGEWDEKTVTTKGCPQRGRQPALDLSPDNSTGTFTDQHLPDGDFYGTDWTEETGAKACMLDYDDKPGIDNNEAVPQRKGWKFREHGWQIEPSEALPSGESGASNKADRSIPSSQKPRGARG